MNLDYLKRLEREVSSELREIMQEVNEVELKLLTVMDRVQKRLECEDLDLDLPYLPAQLDEDDDDGLF